MIEEINGVIKKGSVIVQEHDPVSICLGSDLNLLLVKGLQSASSKYPCPFCRAIPKQRCSAGVSIHDFNEPTLLLSLENMSEDCIVEECAMKTIPLFDTNPGFFIPDVLHMRMRILNRLMSRTETTGAKSSMLGVRVLTWTPLRAPTAAEW